MSTPAQVIGKGGLLAPYFTTRSWLTPWRGDSWQMWRAILKAAYAEPLTDAELELYRKVAGDRPLPERQVKELIVVAGRRSGKDSVASAIAVTAAMQDYSDYLRPGERASVMCLAPDRRTAAIVKNYISGYFTRIPALTPMVSRETDDGLELTNNVEVAVFTNDYRAVRGRSVALAILDEACFMRSSESARPDHETYAAVMPAMATIPGAMLVIITTAYAKRGLTYEKWAAHFGNDTDPDVLVVYGSSFDFNPSLSRKEYERHAARDQEEADAEYLSVWRSDLSDLFDRALINAATDAGVQVRPPSQNLIYTAFADPSGGRGDSFTLAIAHQERGISILDCLFEKRAPFDPNQTVEEIANLLRSYHLSEVTGDRYAANWVTAGFSRAGITYRQSERDRSQLYLDLLPLFSSGSARLLDNDRLAFQLTNLQRSTRAGGRDKVDHPRGQADDCANAAAGALTLTANGAPLLWTRRNFFGDDEAPVPWPTRARGVYISAATDNQGVMVAYWAIRGHAGDVLLVDYERVVPSRYMLGTAIARAQQLAAMGSDAVPRAVKQIPYRGPGVIAITGPGGTVPIGNYFPSETPQGIAAIVTPELRRYLPPEAITFTKYNDFMDKLDAERERLVLECATRIAAGDVKVSTLALRTAQSLPLPLDDLRVGVAPCASQSVAIMGILGSMKI